MITLVWNDFVRKCCLSLELKTRSKFKHKTALSWNPLMTQLSNGYIQILVFTNNSHEIVVTI
jgi:hypothetical protein